MKSTTTNPNSSTVPRSPLAELVSIAAPVVATMTSYTLMQFVDKLIVSRIGPDPIYVSAQGDGGIAAFTPISIAMGCLTVVNTYVSQNLGAGRPERGAAYAWNGMWIAIAWSILLIPYGLYLPEIFTAIGREPRHVNLAASYGQVLIFGSALTMCTRCLAQFFYGLHKPAVVFVASLTANIINLVLSVAFVHGKWGFPALGVVGSAIGTVIATFVELAIPMAFFLGPTMNRLYGTRRAWRVSRQHVRDIMKLGWPGGLMFGNEMVCWTFFMVYLVGHFGGLHSTAGWIAHQWMTLSFMPAVGISVALTATVGKCMGMGRPDLALQRVKVGMGIMVGYMCTCGLLFIIFRDPMIHLFIEKDTPPADVEQLVKLGSAMLIACAAFQFFDAVAMAVSGALRGAGDTLWPGVTTVILAWTLIVGGGLAMVHFVPQLSSLGPWIAAASYIASLGIALSIRFLGGKWKTIALVERRGDASSTSLDANATNPAVAGAATTDGIV